MNEPHKHAEMVKAWADGHDIQTRWRSTKTGEWTEWRDEEWNDVEFFYDHEYRIKPEPKPDVVKYLALANDNKSWFEFANPVYEGYPRFHTPQIKIIRNGETGQLINAEVLK